MRRFFPILLCGLASLVSATAGAQTTERVRGTISAFDGHELSVKSRDGKDLKMKVTEATGVTYPKAIRLADIKPGDYIGTAAEPNAEGKLVAREVHLFPESSRGVGEGHRAWDSAPGATMTNANLTKMVQANNGHELTLEYKGGSQTVLIPEGTPLVTAVPGDRSLLQPGTYIFAIVEVQPDGSLTASRIQATKDGVKPPL
ncbi:DUF5666 domain-containing protein [Propionivibrio soli]|uniref:DUF5666 domain-containing protein n=1 Tax=Propionivibrio soli TaxID=2976531 RepID=UPI0021E78440|nr:DUF5666 domain-containing protein [Propionivibrio soli]